MSFLGNPANNVGRQFKKQQSYVKTSAKDAIKYIDPKDALNTLKDAGKAANSTIAGGQGAVDTAVNNGIAGATGTLSAASNAIKTLPGISMTGTGLNGTVGPDGVNLSRSGEAQGWMDTLGQGLHQDQAAYSGLLGQIAPGFGLLSQSAEQTLENAKAKSVGDLQATLAQRRVLGSSFANDQIASVKNQYDQDIQKAKAEALVQELQMTQGVINDRTTARLNTIKQATDQINYETGVGATLAANTQNNMTQLAGLQADLAKALATINAGITQAGIAATTDLTKTGALVGADLAKTSAGISADSGIAKAQVAGNLSQIAAQGFGQNADLQVTGKQAQNNTIGTLAGNALGMANFNFGKA